MNITEEESLATRMVKCGNPYCGKKHRHSERVIIQTGPISQSISCPICHEPSYIEITENGGAK